jgi:hypothetical protein
MLGGLGDVAFFRRMHDPEENLSFAAFAKSEEPRALLEAKN